MPASPLAAALMGGSGNETAVFGMDPAIMAAQPDLQLAQAMMQSGLSTAPASPWQAAGRLAQALSGSYIQHDALSKLQGAYGDVPEKMAQALEAIAPNDPLIPALRSDNPIVRMQAAQQFGKVLTLHSEVQRVSPNATTNIGASPVATNVQPQSPPGKIATDIQHAQQSNPAALVPLGQALTKETTEGGIALPPSGIPGGPPRVGAPPTPSAGIAPPQKPAGSILPNGEQIIGGGTNAAPTAAVEPPATFDQRFKGALPVPGFAESNAAISGAKTAADEAAKNQAQFGDLLKPQGPIKPGPGTTEPIKTAAGTIIPPLKEQGPIPTNPAQLKDAVPAWQKTVSDWNASIQPSQQAEQRLQTIAAAFKEIETGKFTTDKANFAQILKAVGIDPTKLNLADPSAVQLALHENYVETLQQLKATTPRFTQAEFKGLSANKESPDQPPAANLQMLAEDIGTLRQSRDLPSDFTAAKGSGWVNPQSFEQAWLKQNPLSGYVKRAKDEIGPLKGMPGFQGPAKPGAYVWTPDGGIAPK